MPKIFSTEERQMVLRLANEGHSHTVIANKMRAIYPEMWGSKTAHRSVARIIKNEQEEIDLAKPEEPKTLDEMSRVDRFEYVESRVAGTARFKMVFEQFGEREKEVFVNEYLKIMKSTDTITEVEEQALFACILELILAFQALRRKEQEEKWRDDSFAGLITENDVKFRRVVDDKYHKEYDAHMKLYQKGTEQLKMSRKDRLKVVSSQKQSLVDLAQELSSRNAQSEVAEDIERLSKQSDRELKKMLESGYLFGIFEEYQ